MAKKIKVQNQNRNSSFERMETSEIVFKIIAYVFLTLFALICLYPFIYSFSASISSSDALGEGRVYLWPVEVQWDAVHDVLTDSSFWMDYSNTLFITLYGTVYMMALSILGAYALAKGELFGNKFFNFALVFTMWFTAGMVPTWINYTNTRNLFSTVLHITDQKWVVVIAMGFSAFNIIILRNAFQAVPKEITEAAVVDGANDFQIMSKVYVPMSKASVATVALFYGVSRWNGYFWAREIIRNAVDYPLQVQIRVWLENNTVGDHPDWLLQHNYTQDSYMYAMIVAAIIPILIIYPFIQKYFASGVNLGGVKE